MSTIASRKGFAQSRAKRGQLQAKIESLFENTHDQIAFNDLLALYKAKYPTDLRDASNAIISMYFTGKLSKKEWANCTAYFIPEIPLTKLEILNRQLERAYQRQAEVNATFDRLRFKIAKERAKLERAAQPQPIL